MTNNISLLPAHSICFMTSHSFSHNLPPI